jgi:thioesterase domain-containing protein
MLVFLIELLEGKELAVTAAQNFSSKILEEKLLSCSGLHILPITEQQKYFEQIKLHLKSLKNYIPGTYHGDVVFFEAKERFFRMKDVSLATTWQSLIQGKISAHEVAGAHLNMLIPPHLTNLAKQLEIALVESV